MRLTIAFTISSLFLTLLSVSNAQVIGGGSEYQFNPSNWEITYQNQGTLVQAGETVDPGSGSWNDKGLTGKAWGGLQVPLSSSRSQGKVIVTARWINQNFPPPEEVRLYISAYARASATGLNRSLSVSTQFGDAVTDDPVRNSIYTFGKHLVRKKLNGGSAQFEISVDANASAQGADSYAYAYCAIQAFIDRRYASIEPATGAPYYQKGPDGTGTFTIWNNLRQEYITKTYTKYKQTPATWAFDGTGYSLEVDYGLAQGKDDLDAMGHYYSYANPASIGYVASVYQLREGNEKYWWYSTCTNSPPAAISTEGPSETLPTGLFGDGWDILPYGKLYLGPILEIIHDSVGRVVTATQKLRAASESETVTFKYLWNDGVQAEAQLVLLLHKQFEEDELLVDAVDYEPNSAYEAYNIVDPVTIQSMQWAPVGSLSCYVTPNLNKTDFKAIATTISTIKTFAGGVISEAVGYFASIIQTSLEFANEPAQNLQLQRAGWDEALSQSRVDLGSLNGLEDLVIPPGKTYADYFYWRADYRKEYVYRYSTANQWDEHGYKGQYVGSTNRRDVPINAVTDSSKQYWYKYPG